MSQPGSSARDRHWLCAQRIRERRQALGITQLEVAARLHRRGNHLTNRALSAMENGRGLDVGLLPELAACLGCTTTYLLGLTADPQAWHPDGPGSAEARTTRLPTTVRQPAPSVSSATGATDGDAVPAHAIAWPAVGILGPELPRFRGVGPSQRGAGPNRSPHHRPA